MQAMGQTRPLQMPLGKFLSSVRKGKTVHEIHIKVVSSSFNNGIILVFVFKFK
jgi:hypothetical protein